MSDTPGECGCVRNEWIDYCNGTETWRGNHQDIFSVMCGIPFCSFHMVSISAKVALELLCRWGYLCFVCKHVCKGTFKAIKNNMKPCLRSASAMCGIVCRERGVLP